MLVGIAPQYLDDSYIDKTNIKQYLQEYYQLLCTNPDNLDKSSIDLADINYLRSDMYYKNYGAKNWHYGFKLAIYDNNTHTLLSQVIYDSASREAYAIIVTDRSIKYANLCEHCTLLCNKINKLLDKAQ